MTKYETEMIETARMYLGTKEGSAKHKKLIDTYNSITPLPHGYKLAYSDAWCAAFVSAIAELSGCGKRCYPDCNVNYMVKTYRKNKRFTKKLSRAAAGDYVIYEWNRDGIPDHIGLLVAIDGYSLTVIEGNKSDAVGYRVINAKDVSVYGYCINDVHALADGAKNDSNGASESDGALYDHVAMDVIRGKYGNGAARYQALRTAGYDPDKVQEVVNEIMHKTYGR